jgi:hypothetical protein
MCIFHCNQKKYDSRLCESILYSFKLFLFIGIIFLVAWLFLDVFYGLCLGKTFLILYLGNLLIVILNHIFHYRIGVRMADEQYIKDHLNQFPEDTYIRGVAGILEIIFYLLCFAIELPEFIVGYLILKTISAWKKEESKVGEFSKQKKEGLSTAVLRIAVILSLIVAFLGFLSIPPGLKDIFETLIN